jgi:hypothetical protein
MGVPKKRQMIAKTVMGIEPRGFLLVPCVLWNSMGLYDDILPE